MRILVTNDDGIDAPGIHVLAIALANAGHSVVVAAPNREQSGTGAAIGVFRSDMPIAIERRDISPTRVSGDTEPGVRLSDTAGWIEAYAVDGTPALCALAARLGGFGPPPDLVVSGINLGLNTGRVVLHSGTVGAALTAQSFGGKALAVSSAGNEDGSGSWSFETAARCAVEVIPMLAAAPDYSALNLNVPALPYDELKGMRWARLAPYGAVRSTMLEGGDGMLRLSLEPTNVALPATSDTELCAQGYATLTAIVGVSEIWHGDDGHGLANGRVDINHVLPDSRTTTNVHSRLHA